MILSACANKPKAGLGELFCRTPWLPAWPCATNLGLTAARPPTLRVCARPVRATCRPRAQKVSRNGQLSAPRGLRIRAYGSPLARSASGRVLSPHYAAIWPTAALSGASVRHASRPGSGAHPTRGRPVCYRHALVRARPAHQPARAANQIVFMLCCTTLNNSEPAPESVARESLQPNESRNSAF